MILWVWLHLNKWTQIKWSLHPLFVMILLLSALTGYFIELLTLFAIVIVHELGHVIMAHAMGWRVSSVKLLPFGGVVEVEEAAGASAQEEMLVAVAGPLQNIWMIVLAYVFGELGWWSLEWTTYFIEANLWIAVFNLLPVMPLDGGKIAQALLSYRLSYYATLLWTARISVAISAMIIIYSLLPVILKSGGIKLNELMIGIFLLASNMTTLRNIPFLFYRFMLQRHAQLKRKVQGKKKEFPILTPANQTLYEALKSYRRNRTNLLCIIDRLDQPFRLLPEQEALEHCVGGEGQRAVGELLR